MTAKQLPKVVKHFSAPVFIIPLFDFIFSWTYLVETGHDQQPVLIYYMQGNCQHSAIDLYISQQIWGQVANVCPINYYSWDLRSELESLFCRLLFLNKCKKIVWILSLFMFILILFLSKSMQLFGIGITTHSYGALLRSKSHSQFGLLLGKYG